EGGDTAGARRVVTTALDTLRVVGDAAGEAAALGALGDRAAREGIGLTAESLYRRGLDRLGAAPAPSVSWPLHAGLGDALQSRGAFTEAATELRAAAADVERVAGRLPLEQRRASYLADKWEVYAQLALVERARGRTEEAFDASERLRARQMLDLLARGRIAWQAADGDTLLSREQDLRLRITELTLRLEDAAEGPSWRAPLERLDQRLIEPIEAAGLLRGKRALVIAPHAELHYLPFAALQRPGATAPFLVERYVVTTVPSASVWLRLRE